jgi:ethanolamine utilization cobalamin adenosyltransferase
MMARYGETSQRPTSSMKVARKNTDTAFRSIIDQIEALATVNGLAPYEPFIRELNAVIERYKNILAAEAGRRKN